MEAIELEDFVLEPFDYENIDHRTIAVLLDNDSYFHDYVGETYYLVASAEEKKKKGMQDQVYIVKKGELYLGIISLIILNDNPYLVMGVIPEMRMHYYGYNILREYLTYLFNVYGYDAIFASIHPKNEKSINNVLKLGFKQISKTQYAIEHSM